MQEQAIYGKYGDYLPKILEEIALLRLKIIAMMRIERIGNHVPRSSIRGNFFGDGTVKRLRARKPQSSVDEIVLVIDDDQQALHGSFDPLSR